MLNIVNIQLGNNNNNKIKRIYNKGNIILVRPQTIKYPYKILSIKEKKYVDNTKLIKKTRPTINYIANNIRPITVNLSKEYKSKLIDNINSEKKRINKSNFKESFIVNNKITSNNKNNSHKDKIRKKIYDLENNKNIIDNIITNRIKQRHNEDNTYSIKNIDLNKFFQKEDLIFNKSVKIGINTTNNEINKINKNYISYSEKKNKKFNYSEKFSNDNNKMSYKNIMKNNISLKKNIFSMKNANKPNKNESTNKSNNYFDIYKSKTNTNLIRNKSIKIKSNNKYKISIIRPLSSDNKKDIKKINYENKKNKNEINKNEVTEPKKIVIENEIKCKKCMKRLKIQRTLKKDVFNALSNYNKGVKSIKFQNYSNLKKNKQLQFRKNSDIYNYIVISPTNSENNFTDYKSNINSEITN